MQNLTINKVNYFQILNLSLLFHFCLECSGSFVKEDILSVKNLISLLKVFWNKLHFGQVRKEKNMNMKFNLKW